MSKEGKSILFTIFLFILFCIMAWEASSFADKAKFFPFFVAIGAAFISFVSIILQTVELIRNKSSKGAMDNEEVTSEVKGVLKYTFWFIGYIALIYIIGFMLATISFLLLFLLLESKFRVFTTILSTLFVVGMLLLFGNIMNLQWPIGLLGINIFG